MIVGWIGLVIVAIGMVVMVANLALPLCLLLVMRRTRPVTLSFSVDVRVSFHVVLL